MDYESLRVQHKQFLVERAFSVFEPPFEDYDQQKEAWVGRLLDGHDVEDFLARLKVGAPVWELGPEEESDSGGDRVGAIRLASGDVAMYAGIKTSIRVRIRNDSERSFETTPAHPLFVSYHWYEENGEVCQFDGVRTALPTEIPPGAQEEVPVDVIPPAEPSTYRLMITMVHEGVCWMEGNGLETPVLEWSVNDYDGRGLSHHAHAIFGRLHAGTEASVN